MAPRLSLAAKDAVCSRARSCARETHRDRSTFKQGETCRASPPSRVEDRRPARRHASKVAIDRRGACEAAERIRRDGRGHVQPQTCRPRFSDQGARPASMMMPPAAAAALLHPVFCGAVKVRILLRLVSWRERRLVAGDFGIGRREPLLCGPVEKPRFRPHRSRFRLRDDAHDGWFAGRHGQCGRRRGDGREAGHDDAAHQHEVGPCRALCQRKTLHAELPYPHPPRKYS
jgi:hypothetical protein